MSNTIFPCFWCDGNAKEVAEFYCRVFKDSQILEENPMVVTFQASGEKFMCLNGGPEFQITPSISIYTIIDSEEEIQAIWDLLIQGGSEMMPLDTYPWSKKYGWVKDRFGVTWQLTLDKPEHSDQKFIPCLMFSEGNFGKAEAAINFYTTIFEGSSLVFAANYGKEHGEQEGKIMHAQFFLRGKLFAVMDSSIVHGFNFNEGFSLVASCDQQQQIDHYWDMLTKNGTESMCGWLKDQFGVSWQIVPANLGRLVADPIRGKEVITEFMKMKKLDLAQLEKAGT
ncbi:VOC family protein [Algoriphagus machipongonensis]|uniref:3-demethylubiquinone-9 3-methyltransferase domain protein n=1 Tax=Algoriphagus machipongonensis TaxID=388413 RepID=A3HVY6_9BACT|nr:VOC family protein [Algoriphagus machipongonensis]EAZ82308.1 3-demethylubiquinone-9 3-methyltransferase domain protein [Algoriphagus machipongonensis]